MTNLLISKPFRFFIFIVVLIVLLTSIVTMRESNARSPLHMTMAPEFTHTKHDEWINTAPLTLASLRGKVVLIEFWTYGCWNCYRSFPWLNDLEAKYLQQSVIVIGVHTPEFEHEKRRDNVIAKVKEFKLQHPVMLDNDFSYWRAMKNRYWPSYYLVDKQGRIRGTYVGETHADSRQARAIEQQIQVLLKEES